ncbi:MAG: hypothetical protein A2719_05445 [Candidatus Ryanbacteria bacterium RIFCSPHIGHO2_01_FULL_45_22]|uniref:DoxX family protein n=2 Tax=Candidatus Ryaniibacteriota TaxID=1817914 RepID=A0A1G2FZ20_9BACT|nr:MAG: hypothetical protein A2719_05445 [Candidatus Ryanbacteria bacterium RIFCSPHIGHO2_01_FULL_45_22]OGZ45397.1 MAG: hypothetical protein A3J54_00920 [Candidatus Ryanbacteria bacterium RIFCSPHIGHO2_02_FULL_45_13b]
MENDFIVAFDKSVLTIARSIAVPVERFALFIVFFWFGFLKLIDASPANPLVGDLLRHTIPFWSLESFMVFLGLWEMLIGVAFLVGGWERLAIALLIPHMITTVLPFLFLPDVVWHGFFVPTLEGQYIIKNSVIVALALGFAARLQPLRRR